MLDFFLAGPEIAGKDLVLVAKIDHTESPGDNIGDGLGIFRIGAANAGPVYDTLDGFPVQLGNIRMFRVTGMTIGTR